MKFEPGDLVEVLKTHASNSFWLKGEQFLVTYVSNSMCYGSKEGKSGDNYVENFYLKLVRKKEAIHFNVGDIVEVLVDRASGSYWKKGETFKVLEVGKEDWRGMKEGKDYSQYVYFKDLKLINPIRVKDGGNMKKVISDTYTKTVNALLVEKHLGSQITDNFIGGLIVKKNKIEILDEARRLEAIEVAKKS